MKQHHAIVVPSAQEGSAQLTSRIERDCVPGEVKIVVHYSSVNYKDALAVTGKGKILRTFPLVPGIDLAGVVIASKHREFNEGDEVLATGCGSGETHDGGFTEVVNIAGEHLVRLPQGLTLRTAMELGTAGFTVGLAIERMQINGQTPGLGPIVVTGASGGVGAIAVNLLSQLGYEVIAISGKREFYPFLERLGANKVCSSEDLKLGTRPLEAARFGGAIDNIGGQMLAQLLAATQLWGNVAAVGMAGGMEFQGTVMPHILRGVNLIGVSSNNCAMALRRVIWERLANTWRPQLLREIVVAEIGLNDVISTCVRMLDRKTHGRTLVRVTPSS